MAMNWAILPWVGLSANRSGATHLAGALHRDDQAVGAGPMPGAVFCQPGASHLRSARHRHLPGALHLPPGTTNPGASSSRSSRHLNALARPEGEVDEGISGWAVVRADQDHSDPRPPHSKAAFEEPMDSPRMPRVRRNEDPV